ncbi:MAG: ribulokinase [Chloroflexi bacterium]|nr:MAG: ribulokinase [Chloroflexi bacterium OLB13]MBC6956014.1 ribulokinase [Chloroflexota bacterium]MBW7878254.1 ribulokinase [Anaerolineae bacterium]MDL1915649.1 ribulokinase [Anaerolineae bacterium CFX4]OQY84839.1 MAG: ribulokinase [Anaerolineae bacterium UTCFX5]
MYTLGIDFGTLSGRALLVDVRDGREIATAVFDYPHGVMDERLPSGKRLGPEWALQHPQDYLDVFTHTIPAVLKDSGVDPAQVVGLAVDFTASSPMPVKADGTPLCFLDAYRDEPHAYVKLWKHHASQPQADRINAVARERGETWLQRYGGKYSSEWFFSKLLQILDESPATYDAIDTFIEAADWVIWQLTGVMTRNTCTAGYKMLVQDGQYPSPAYFAALHPDFGDVIATKVTGEFAPLGGRAGSLTPQMAEKLGLPAGIAVAVANVDAHVTAPAVKATQPGVMVMIMGTSTCHIMSSDSMQVVDGMCGVVDGGIVDGLYGYEAGQSAVGDIFAWFVENAVPPEYHDAARAAGLSLHEYLERESAKQKPGEHGLLALDWWNGNRSTLVDTELSGLLIGATLATRAPDIYRALIEATAYGTREIIEAFEARGVEVKELVAAGGLPDKNALLRQIYADVTGRELRLAGSSQSPALGAAMHAAVAAGVYPDIHAAAEKMGKLKAEVVRPIAANQAVYDQLYAEYKTLYNTFGRGANDVMKRLKKLRNEARGE